MSFIERDSKNFFKLLFLKQYLQGHKGYIAGGCFKNIFQGKRIKDVDIFFHSFDDFNEAYKYFKDNPDYEFVYENTNAICFKNKETKIPVEIIRNSYGTPREMFKNFDFSITKFAYVKETKDEEETFKCILHENFFEDLVTKKLVVETEIFNVISTFERSLKYTRYGFGLCRESKQNILNALKTADITNLSRDLYFGID